MSEDVKINAIDSIDAVERRKQYYHEYVRKPEVMERARETSLKRSKERKLMTTMGRFEEHSFEELMRVVAIKCAQKGLDFDAQKEDFSRLIRVLHDPV